MPFTVEQFFEVFRQYNHALWPVQLLLYAPALATLAAIWRQRGGAGRVVSASLAVLWLWLGAVYHFGFFRGINPAANLFAALSVAGAGLFLWHGVVHENLRFVWAPGWRGGAAAALIAYALLVYPAIGFIAGHDYWESPSFGTPCPTTVFTLGVLMLAARPVPTSVLVAPVLWALVGTFAALSLNVPQDFGLAVAAALLVAGARTDS